MKRLLAAFVAVVLTAGSAYADIIVAAPVSKAGTQCRKVADTDFVDGRTFNACAQTLLNNTSTTAGTPEFVQFCGQNDENGTIYLGPNTVAFGGDGSDGSLASTACDALDSATEATADAPILANTAFQVKGFWCKTAATLGTGESITFTLRSAAANTVPALSCTISESQTTCATASGTTTAIAAGATVAIKAVEVGDNADDDSWCRVAIVLQ